MSLDIQDVHVRVKEKEILRGVSLGVEKNTVVVVMGPNGSGKSTLANSIGGHPTYHITDGVITVDGEPIHTLSPDERAKKGVFLSMQYIPEIPGVSIAHFLRTAYNSVFDQTVNPLKFYKILEEKAKELLLDVSFLKRDMGVGFSGGEKKKLEMLQLSVLSPKYAILDETDSGLDVDALRTVASGINNFVASGGGVLLITHYHRLLEYVTPDTVLIMEQGSIIQRGGKELAKKIEREGYTHDKKHDIT